MLNLKIQMVLATYLTLFIYTLSDSLAKISNRTNRAERNRKW